MMIFHIGLHKTGTTFIQQHIFPSFKNITMIRAWYNQRKIIETDFKRKILFTDEGISGNPWQGNYSKEFKRNVLNIKRLYGSDVSIIFGVRKHSDFLLSLYKQYLHQKGCLDIDYLFNLENTGLLKHADLNFLNKIEFLKNEFKSVFVYSQEALKKDLFAFTEALSIFLNEPFDEKFLLLAKGQTNNVGVYTNLQVKTLKKLNRINSGKYIPDLYGGKFKKYKLTPRDICQKKLKNFKSKPYELPVEIVQFVNQYYSNDWKNIQQHINTP